MDLEKYIFGISEIPRNKRNEVLLNQKNTNKPFKSFGKLEEVGYKLTEIIGIGKKEIQSVIIVFAGDHGIAELDLSVFPKDHTKKVVNLLHTHKLPINKIADTYNIPLHCYDIGIDGKVEYNDVVHDLKISNGTKNMLHIDAIEKENVSLAIKRGIDVAKKCFEDGVRIAALGEVGICNTISTSVLTAILCGLNEEDVTDRGTGVMGLKLQQKQEYIKRMIVNNRQHSLDIFGLLGKVAGYEICGDIGFILGCSYYRIPVVIDGYITGVAALAAYRLQPNVKNYIYASHLSAEKGHKHIMKEIGIEPIIDFGMKYGLATGAAIALPIYKMAYKLVNE